MPRRRTHYNLFDETWQIDIAWLRDEGLLVPDRQVLGWRLYWVGGFAVTIDSDTSVGHVRITHEAGGDRSSSVVRLERRPSNLGRGAIWYLVCPATGRLCRKLYLFDGCFRSRYAFPLAMYRSQAEPKGDRRLRRYITLNGTLKKPYAVWDYSDRKHFRMYYKGKPTKRYSAYLERMAKIRALLEAGSVTEMNLEKKFSATLSALESLGLR